MAMPKMPSHPAWKKKHKAKYGDEIPRHCCFACFQGRGGLANHGLLCKKVSRPRKPKPKKKTNTHNMRDLLDKSPKERPKFNPED
jgi:hypothetical protein